MRRTLAVIGAISLLIIVIADRFVDNQWIVGGIGIAIMAFILCYRVISKNNIHTER
jgi:hypothetical protein